MPRRTPVADPKPIIPDPPPSAPAVTPPDAPKARASAHGERICAVCGNTTSDAVCPVDGSAA